MEDVKTLLAHVRHQLDEAGAEQIPMPDLEARELTACALGIDRRLLPALGARPVTASECEKTEALEPFHPDRIASRILGMGDVLSLIEDIESKVDRAQAEKLASKLKKGDGFDLNDFLEQLRQMKNMGGMASLMGKLPGMGQIPDNVKSQMDDKVLVRMEAIINSMTMKERAKPEIIKGSRKRRIAAGCGMQVQDVNRLLKQFDDMQRMMKKMKKGGMAKMMRSMKGMMPPGFPGR